MARWFGSSRTRKSKIEGDPPKDVVFELLVLEGEDAGRSFAIDGDVVSIRRGTTSVSAPGQILLTDPTVSSRQAWIRRSPEGLFIEHREDATKSDPGKRSRSLPCANPGRRPHFLRAHGSRGMFALRNFDERAATDARSGGGTARRSRCHQELARRR